MKVPSSYQLDREQYTNNRPAFFLSVTFLETNTMQMIVLLQKNLTNTSVAIMYAHVRIVSQ